MPVLGRVDPCCLACGKRGPTVLRCTRCKVVWFCGRECQRALWASTHKHVCGEHGGPAQREMDRCSKGSLCLSWRDGRPVVVVTQDLKMGSAVVLDTGLIFAKGMPEAAARVMCKVSETMAAQLAVATGPLTAYFGDGDRHGDADAFAPARFSLTMDIMFGSGRVRNGRLFSTALAFMRHTCVPSAFVTVMRSGPRFLPLVVVTLARELPRNGEVTICYAAGMTKARCAELLGALGLPARCTCMYDRAEALCRALVMVGVTDEDVAVFMQRDFRQGLCLVVALAQRAVNTLPLAVRPGYQVELLRLLQPFTVNLAEKEFGARLAVCRRSLAHVLYGDPKHGCLPPLKAHAQLQTQAQDAPAVTVSVLPLELR